MDGIGRSEGVRAPTLVSWKEKEMLGAVRRVPGLWLARNRVGGQIQTDLADRVVGIHNALTSLLEFAPLHKAPSHNLDEGLEDKTDGAGVYRSVRLPDLGPGGESVVAQVFAGYGSEGHTLSYFLGRKNIPVNIGNTLIPVVEALVKECGIADEVSGDWRLSMNVYGEDGEKTGAVGDGEEEEEEEEEDDASFGWHKDIGANGDFTAITSLAGVGEIEFRSPLGEVVGVALDPGSVLIASGPARWEWDHRVVSTSPGRLSLVLGARI